jgi:hypothetical protein
VLPESEVRLLHQILCGGPIVRPGQEEPEDVRRESLVGPLVLRFNCLDGLGQSESCSHTPYTPVTPETHGVLPTKSRTFAPTLPKRDLGQLFRATPEVRRMNLTPWRFAAPRLAKPRRVTNPGRRRRT